MNAEPATVPKDGDRRFAMQALSVLATKVLMLASGLLASIVIARALGPTGLGTYTAVFAVVTLVLTLADLGIRQATTYLMGGRTYDDETIVGNVLALLLVASVLATTIVAIVFWVGPARAHGAAVLVPALASIPLLLTIAFTKGAALAKGWIRRVNLADVWQKGGFLAALVLLLLVLDAGIAGATLAHALGAGMAAVLSLFWLQQVAPLRPRFDRPVVARLLRLGIVYAVVLFALNLNYRIDIVLIEALLGPREVGFYAVGVRFAELVWQLPAALGVVLFSASARASGSHEAVERTISVLRTTLPLVVAACLAIAIVAPWLIPGVFGAAFEASIASTRLLMPGVATAVVFKLLYADVAGRGRPAAGLWVFVPMAAANVVLNLVLIPRSGIEGAALATSITYVLGAVAFATQYGRREGVSVRDLFVPRRSDVALLGRRRPPDRSGSIDDSESGRTTKDEA
jgi:O-antigen/teichoic acid export membrane protein